MQRHGTFSSQHMMRPDTHFRLDKGPNWQSIPRQCTVSLLKIKSMIPLHTLSSVKIARVILIQPLNPCPIPLPRDLKIHRTLHDKRRATCLPARQVPFKGPAPGETHRASGGPAVRAVQFHDEVRDRRDPDVEVPLQGVVADAPDHEGVVDVLARRAPEGEPRRFVLVGPPFDPAVGYG